MKLFIVLFAIINLALANVWIDKHGGYHNVLFAVDKKVPIEDCFTFQRQIEVLGNAFSENLWYATKRRFHVASINVVMPFVSRQHCDITAARTLEQSWKSADVKITSGWNINEQWAPEGSKAVGVQQSSGCGVKGEYITLNSTVFDAIPLTNELSFHENEYLTNPTNLLGQSLAMAWIRYRFGVFEESVSDVPNEVEVIDRMESGVNDADLSIISSLSVIDSSKRPNLCTIDSHDSDSRNSQNLICYGLSPLEVMQSHQDFQITNNKRFTSTKNLQEHQFSSVDINRQSEPENRQEFDVTKTTEVDGDTVNYRQKRQTPIDDSNISEIKNLPLIQDLVPINILEAHTSKEKKKEESKIMEDTGIPTITESPVTSSNNSNAALELAEDQIISNDEVIMPVEFSVNASRKNKTQPRQNVTQFTEEPEKPPKTVVTLFTLPPKVVILALDLSSASIAQASVEWLRGGLLRWLFGLGNNVMVAVLASYSNTSFPLSLGPLSPGPTFSHQLEEHLALLPYQHEIDDDVYGGEYCLSCILEESHKLLKNANIPAHSAVVVLAACQPTISEVEVYNAQNSGLKIHSVALCPNAPLSLDAIGYNTGTWALPPSSIESPLAETQLGRTLNDITREAFLWPGDSQLVVVKEEEKLLREDDVERIGPYRRVKAKISLETSPLPRLLILTTSSAAKVVDIWANEKRISINKDTPRRYWVLLEEDWHELTYTLKFLSTSLSIPLTITTGVYQSSPVEGIRIRLSTNKRRYNPMDLDEKFLKVSAEVTNNGKRITDADVTLSLTYIGGPGPSSYSLFLLDDGSTEPDMRRNDGIYSRYLTWIPGTGRYILTATASSTPNSVVRDGASRSIKTGHFSSTSTSLSIIIESVPNGDIFPPSRVTDLEAAALEDKQINLTWTAPGGDLDHGSAWRYSLKMYTDRNVLMEGDFEDAGIEVYCLFEKERAPIPSPALFGSQQYCTTSIPFGNLRWYFALRSLDGANNTGEISNIASVFIAETETTRGIGSLDLTDESSIVAVSTTKYNSSVSLASMSEEDWKLYGTAIAAAIFFVMMVIIIAAIILCCRKRKRRAKDEDRPIYKIYVNNAYIQEEDGEIKVMSKKNSMVERDSTQKWINALDGTKTHVDQLQADNTEFGLKCQKPMRFGVLTNGSIMRDPTSSSSSASSKPSDETLPEDFKYKDLSETISNSTTEEVLTGSTVSTSIDIHEKELKPARAATYIPPQNSINYEVDYRGFNSSFQPLGVPPLPGPTIIRINSNSVEYSSEDEGGFRPFSAAGIALRKGAQFASFRNSQNMKHPMDIFDMPPGYNTVSKGSVLPHGTVRSVKKRRHISFV